ncbi:MAG TPA: hypothetical protein VIT90_04925 [Lysobacter sp.]
MHDRNGNPVAALFPQGSPPRGAASLPRVALPLWPGRRFVDLVADSLREVARGEGDAMYRLMADAVVQHLAADVQGGVSRRSVEDALDGVLSLISRELQRQVARSGASIQAPMS